MAESAVSQLLGMLVVSLVSIGVKNWYLQPSPDQQTSSDTQQSFSAANFMYIMLPYTLFRIVLSMRVSSKEATLYMRGLNHVHSFKELFANYLQAALLEPILDIAGNRNNGRQIFMNILMLASIAWWTWIISDAFDWEDTLQEFKFRQMIQRDRKQHLEARISRSEAKDDISWLKAADIHEDQHMGSMVHDLCLWFMICCICAQWCGLVHFSDIWHAYACLALWIVLHHLCWTATSWGQNYLVSLLLPSAALMPLQFCFILRAAENLQDLQMRRRFIQNRCGISLTIVTDVVWASGALQDLHKHPGYQSLRQRA
eukprot:TRINITY_DN59822_c0_g1_i1.p1 TRINITY_DN59822_c0_g1~~TRINITY_DN59822_c0_g1_i1.p1  ORF type:complete len:343 (-),score=42.32 TRINITY_DN59822_c0_g1_i1:250-1191(-)